MSGDRTFRNLAVPRALIEGFPLRPGPAEGLGLVDIAFRAGRFAPAGDAAESDIDACGQMLLPGFVDAHVHLDKAYTARRTGVSRGGLGEAVGLAMADFENRTESDIAERMERALTRAHENGTVALRTHLDTPDMPSASPAWKVFAEKRSRWAGRLTLQAVALMALSRVDDAAGFDRRAGEIAERGGILGAFIGAGVATPERLDRLFSVAERHRLDLDLHVDETLDASANGLALLAQARLRSDFSGRVVAGHCCALSRKEADDLQAEIEALLQADIAVISLPMTNGYLQDQQAGRTPRLRGIAPVKELARGGVAVAFASDNVQDAFFPFGDFDMLSVLRQATILGQLQPDIDRWVAAVNRVPADLTGLSGCGRIAPGLAADAILADARDFVELFSRATLSRHVFRAGQPLGTPQTERLKHA